MINVNIIREEDRRKKRTIREREAWRTSEAISGERSKKRIKTQQRDTEKGGESSRERKKNEIGEERME